MTDNHKKIGSTRAASAGAWGVEYPEYPDVVTVACVNFEGVASDGTSTKPFRLDKMIRQVRDAARQGAQLVVFPESALGALGATCAGCSVDSGPSPAATAHQAKGRTP